MEERQIVLRGMSIEGAKAFNKAIEAWVDKQKEEEG